MIVIPITIFHFKNGLAISKSLFGDSREIDISENLKVVSKGGFIRESKFAIQDKYIEFLAKEINSHNIDDMADFLYEKLFGVEDIDSLKIGDKKIPITKDVIKKALEELLKS